MSITFYVIRIDNFEGHIWDQRIMIVTMTENEVNRRIVLIPTDITTHFKETHPSGQRAFGTRWRRLTTGPRRGKKASHAAEFVRILLWSKGF